MVELGPPTRRLTCTNVDAGTEGPASIGGDSARGSKLERDVEVQRGPGALQRCEGGTDAAGFEARDCCLAHLHAFGEIALAEPRGLTSVADLLADGIASATAA